MIANAGAAAAAAAEAARRSRQEEEEMTSYRREDLDGEWEFKILRSQSNVFRNREKFAVILAEEARSGWELVEKFDDNRLRLKRPLSARVNDASYDVDPYRVWVGMTPNQSAAVVLGIIFGVMAVGAVIAIVVNAF